MRSYMGRPCVNVVEMNIEGGYVIQVQDKRFDTLPIINYVNDLAMDLAIVENNNTWLFSKKVIPGIYSYYNHYSKFSPIVTPESAIFNGYEKVATGRGYIWSRSIPLLKEHIVIGSGPDTFAHVFPQHDYVGLYNFGFTE